MTESINLIHISETDSTSNYLRRNIGNLPVNTVVVTDFQTAGRGCGENKWLCPSGGGALFSILAQKEPPWEGNNLAILSLHCGEIVARRLKDEFGVCASVVPPNDVFAGGSKICGILIEEVGERLIIGVGINTNLVPEAIACGVEASSVYSLTGKECDNVEIARSVAVQIMEELARVSGEYRGVSTPVEGQQR